jgi:hypothetical protein
MNTHALRNANRNAKHSGQRLRNYSRANRELKSLASVNINNRQSRRLTK